jgi:hypothetical protein
MVVAQEQSVSHNNVTTNDVNSNEASSSINIDRDAMTQQLMKEANYFTLASHFFWGLWAINMATSTAIKFGYMVKIKIYFLRKYLFL